MLRTSTLALGGIAALFLFSSTAVEAGGLWFGCQRPAWLDNYFLPMNARTHYPQLPTRPRAEYAPTVIEPGDPYKLSLRTPAYTRPPATVYGPAVAAPGPGVPIYSPQDQGLDPNDPFSQRPCVYEPAYREPAYRDLRPVHCQPSHPLH